MTDIRPGPYIPSLTFLNQVNLETYSTQLLTRSLPDVDETTVVVVVDVVVVEVVVVEVLWYPPPGFFTIIRLLLAHVRR